ncbi:hypothetical protein H5410_024264 [Solanum commersonii]|uniref:Uncharacterized protein n=1 Tax=Solanum commersonii TaxID=4109 RepID=A0A9J5ZLH7_SOLCO|nr:hypothetical protein H5410_024264 [Solanum commersonii]
MLDNQELTHPEDDSSGMRILRWMCGHTRRERIKSRDIWDKVGVASVVDKMREAGLERTNFYSHN